MLTKIPFYHGITRKMIVGFAGLFNNVYVLAKDTNNVTKKIIQVPLAYANKEKFVARLIADPGMNEDAQIVLPRLSFEIVGQEYDSSRQHNKMNKVVTSRGANTVHSYAPVPYNISINLYSFTRTQTDNLQILEQVVPFFTPDMNLSIKVMQDPDVSQDCSLILNSVNTDDSYDGGFEDRRYIVTTYSFTLKMNYYGPLYGVTDAENHFDSGPKTNVIKDIKVNVNTSKYTALIDPFSSNADDVYQIVETWTGA